VLQNIAVRATNGVKQTQHISHIT